MRPTALILCITASLTACEDRPSPSPTAGAGPPFDPITFFEGHTQSRGVIETRSGAPTEQVTTDSLAHVDASVQLHMVQHLTFQDGQTRERTWTVWRTGPHQFDATANDMIGTAKGQSDRRTFHWQWVWARSPGNPLMNVTMEQWMYGLRDGSALIRTTVSKLGFIVAEVTEQFTRADMASSPCVHSAPPPYALPSRSAARLTDPGVADNLTATPNVWNGSATG